MKAFPSFRGVTPSQNLDRSVDDFFNDTYRRMINRPDIDSHEISVPSANVLRDKEKGYVIELAVPGFTREDIDINTHQGILTISGERKLDTENKTEREYARREFSYVTFNRSFTLPDHTLEEKITANHRDGILRVTIPVRQDEETHNKPRRIDIS